MAWLRRQLRCGFGALGYFTRVPVPAWVGYGGETLADAAPYLPTIGVLIGGISALIYLLAATLWPASLAIWLAMASSIYLTGALHEDGLSDTADGLGGGWDKTRILAIMKDSRVGSYGVLAIGMALLGKFTALREMDAALLPWALWCGHAVSRFCPLLLMAGMDYVRDEAASKAKIVARRLSTAALLLSLLPVLPLLACFAPGQILPAIGLAVLATGWLAALCRRWLGGYTGDCLGATQQLGEIAFYLGLLLAWPG